jgi:Tripartite ATP-independent periplasmic transporter, DctM component
MQTSFMHPPFGFALFYLRSVAPHEDYTDKVTKQPIKRVTIEQIYWGAVPFVVIQVFMVGLIIAFPGLVSSGLTKESTIDADKVFQQMQKDSKPTPTLDPFAPGASAPAAGTPAADDTKEDPMKGLMESLKNDQAKKP